MAETLLAILLVTSSAKGCSLVYRWPPVPQPMPRLARPRLAGPPQPDNPLSSAPLSGAPFPLEDYEWKRANRYIPKNRPMPPSPPRDYPSSNQSDVEQGLRERYDDLLGYSSEFLAGILCPHPSLYNQKFELIVDDLAFIGHPVEAEAGDVWCFKPEKHKPDPRGRASRTEVEGSPEKPENDRGISTHSAWLHTFHFVLVLDLPDPSSSASGNVAKYFDIIYEQVAFIVTAVLFQEQVLSNFVERECDAISTFKDQCIKKGAQARSLV
jgi:nitrogen permease regulator 3-like protein